MNGSGGARLGAVLALAEVDAVAADIRDRDAPDVGARPLQGDPGGALKARVERAAVRVVAVDRHVVQVDVRRVDHAPDRPRGGWRRQRAEGCAVPLEIETRAVAHLQRAVDLVAGTAAKREHRVVRHRRDPRQERLGDIDGAVARDPARNLVDDRSLRHAGEQGEQAESGDREQPRQAPTTALEASSPHGRSIGMAPNGLGSPVRGGPGRPALPRLGCGREWAAASLASIEPLLACPRCRAPLALGDDGVRCTNESCPLAAPRSFSYLGPRPVLVHFARSVLEAKHLPGPGATLESQVAHRWSVDRVPKRLRSFLKPANVVAVRNIDLLLALLPAGATVLVVGGGTIGNGTERLYTDRRVEVVAFDIYDSAPGAVRRRRRIRSRSPTEASTPSSSRPSLQHVLDAGGVVAEIHRVASRRRPGLRRDAVPANRSTPAHTTSSASPRAATATSSGASRRSQPARWQARGHSCCGASITWSAGSRARSWRASSRERSSSRSATSTGSSPRSTRSTMPSAFYFLGRRADEELSPHEIIAYYGGAQQGGDRGPGH